MIDWLKGMPAIAGISDHALRDQHLALQRHIRIVRYTVPIAVLVIIATTALHIRSTFSEIRAEDLGGALEKQAARVLPKVQKAAMEVGEQVAPVVGEAFATQLDKAFGRLASRLDSEVGQLGEALPQTLEKQFQRKIEAANASAAEKIYEAFPELRGEPAEVEALMKAFQGGVAIWATRTLTGTFARHIKDLENIKATLNGFVRSQNRATKDSVAAAQERGEVKAQTKITPDQLLALWLEILDEALQGEGGDSDLFEAAAEEPAAERPATNDAKATAGKK